MNSQYYKVIKRMTLTIVIIIGLITAVVIGYMRQARFGKEANGERLIPVHSPKFVIANHPWNEPLIKIT